MKDSKTVLITGCSENGIGHSLALEFHRRGLRVIATARRLESMQRLAAKGIETFSLDVTSQESIDKLHQQLSTLLSGRLDFLINNAGVDYAAPAIETDMKLVQRLFQTNVYGLMQMCQSFSDMLIAGHGTIVNHSSVLGTSLVMPFGSHYNASKAAVLSYSDALRVELEPFGVNVVTLITGEVNSNVLRSDPTLPESSLYKSIQDKFALRAGGKSEMENPRMPIDEYAMSVTSKLLVDSPSHYIWAGTNSGPVWFITTFLPKSIHTRLSTRPFELWRLKANK